MSLKKFNNMNFNFGKEQMQDYLMMKGKIDQIENKNCMINVIRSNHT